MFGMFLRDANNPNEAGLVTPETLKERRAMVRALAEKASSTAPVQHWTQGAARLVDGLNAGLTDYLATRDEAEGVKSGKITDAGLFREAMGTGGETPSATGGDVPGGLFKGVTADQNFKADPVIKDGIATTAQALGISPVDLATTISYETGGTFDPTKRGPTTQWGQHRGLIQFGEPQARQHGVDWNDPVGSQLGPQGAVASYLRTAGVKPGMGLLDIYSAINAGAPGLYNRSDANNGGAPGTVRDKVNNQMAGHRAKALAMFSDLANRGGMQAAAQPVANRMAASGAGEDEEVGKVRPITGDDPVQLRKDAEFYRQSNPEAARQLLLRADMAEGKTGTVTADNIAPEAPPMPPRRPVDLNMGTTQPALAGQPNATPLQLAMTMQQARNATADGIADRDGVTPVPMAGARIVDGRADAPASGAQLAQGVVIPGQQAPQAPQKSVAGQQRMAAAIAVLNNPWSSPGAKMLAQRMLMQEQKDPVAQALQMEQLKKARRENEKTPYSDVTRPDGSVVRVFEDGRQQQIFGPQTKEEGKTTDQRELAQINEERKAAGQPPLTFEQYQKAKGEATKGGTKRSIQPVYGTNEKGETVMLQPGDDGTAVQTQLPPGVKVASGVDRIDAGTKYILIDKRTGQVVGEQAKDLRGAEREKTIGDAEGKSAAGAQKAITMADQTLATIDGILNHPSLDRSLGLPGMVARNIPGTETYGVGQRIAQLQGKAFLEAFETLKGGGAITELEGQKATQAIARLNAAQSPKDFREALGELRSIVEAGRKRAMGSARLGAGAPAGQQPSPDQPASAPGTGPRIISVEPIR